MSDKQRKVFELRTIVVSTRAALLKGDRARVKRQSDDLMAELEAKVMREGADPEILAAVEAARRELWDDRL